MRLLDYPECGSLKDDAQRAQDRERWGAEWDLLSEKNKSDICTCVKENELNAAQATALFGVVEKLFLRNYDTDSIDADELSDMSDILLTAIRGEVL